MKRYYHYTVYHNALGILESGEILPGLPCIQGVDRPAVWLSCAPEWEETVRKAILDPATGEQTPPLSRDGLLKNGFQPARIPVDPQKATVRTWNNFKRTSGLSRKALSSLAKIARQWKANPKDWAVCFEPVPVESFDGPVEVWTGGEWRPVLDNSLNQGGA